MVIRFNIINKIKMFISNNCFEILVISLILHLYGSMFFNDLFFYGTYVRIFNTIFLYFASVISFTNHQNHNSIFFKITLLILFFFNIVLIFIGKNNLFFGIRDIIFLIFLTLTLSNVAKFLISPNRFDKALIFSSLAGYLLIIEIAVRSFMILYRIEKNKVLLNVDFSYHTKTFIDTVYYCTVTITSIGFGDILPINHNAKMLTSILGLSGQFYLVIVMGIMVSKFISAKQK